MLTIGKEEEGKVDGCGRCGWARWMTTAAAGGKVDGGGHCMTARWMAAAAAGGQGG